MARYREVREVEALTWGDIIAHGLASGCEVHDGMPVKFQIGWRPVMMMSEDSYGVVCVHGMVTVNRGEALIVTDRDVVFVVTEEELREKFEQLSTEA